ncbi:MAG TPA: MMPL family transporter, partial [Candidatus Dormibacteraeota bacterium]|nr:MMPL family transporter [Candidatus Dormibacteraeota bacterium]
MAAKNDRRGPAAQPAASFMARLAGFVLHHRKRVMAAWGVLFVAGMIASGAVSNRLSFDFSLPGQPGYETAKQTIATFGNGGDQAPAIEVVTVPAGRTVQGDAGAIAAAFDRARAAVPRVRIVDLGSTGDQRFITSDGRSTFALLFEPTATSFGADTSAAGIEKALRAALPGDTVTTTGLEALASGGDNSGPGVLAETLLAGAGALVVLAVVFASFLALVPLAVAAVSILVTLLVILGLTTLTEVSFIVEFLVSLVGLGVAIDYSLLLVTRWREERAKGADNETAVITAVSTAGRAIALSGLTVGIGLIALVVLPVPGLRSVGIGGMLIPIVSVAVTLTLLPALLGGIGPRVDWPRLRHEVHASRPWTAWARLIVRHRSVAAIAGVALLGVLIIPVFHLETGATSADALSKTGPAHAAYQTLLDGGVPSGVITPIEVLVKAGDANAALQRLQTVPGIVTADVPTGSSRNGLTDLVALPTEETVNSSTLATVTAVRDAMASQPGVIGVSGMGAIELDYSHAVFGTFPLMFTIVALATLLLLARAFRSLVLAAKAVAMNLISLAATFGLLTWFWQDGHGSNALFGIPATGAITFWEPLMVFAFLFGLSMDYEVFILARVREEYDRTGSTDTAVVEGIGRTGRLVTSAALILFLAFASLASAPDTDIKVLATGLGAGILLDATVVRALLVPAVISLLGSWNWYMPG